MSGWPAGLLVGNRTIYIIIFTTYTAYKSNSHFLVMQKCKLFTVLIYVHIYNMCCLCTNNFDLLGNQLVFYHCLSPITSIGPTKLYIRFMWTKVIISSVADLVNFFVSAYPVFKIRIRVTQKDRIRPDPDPTQICFWCFAK